MSTTTERICEVVRITEVLPHPNADRLELAHFELDTGPTAYTCVIAKGQFKVGDRAVYVGVDSIVPTEGRFAFLKQRPDGAGKAEFRIRAARIRGVYSEGLLMEFRDHMRGIGDDMSVLWGIKFYEPKQKGSAFPGANPNKNIDHTLGGLFPEYKVESLKKCPFLFQWGEDVLLTEKVHGSNMRCGYLPVGFFGRERFVVGSHRCVKTDLRNPLQKLQDWLNRKLAKKAAGYYGTDVWTQAAEKYGLAKKLKMFPDTVCYFELYGVTPDGKRIQDLTYGNVELGLILLDAYDADLGVWLNHAELEQLSRSTGVPLYQCLMVGAWHGLDDAKHYAEGKSTMAGAEDQVREGFVVHAPNDHRRGKFVGAGYLLRNEGDGETIADD